MEQICRTKHHPQNNYMEFPHSINVHSASITCNCKAQSLSPQDLSMCTSIFIPYGPTEYPLRSMIISQTRTLRQYSNAPPISENDSRAAPQSSVNSELDDPFIAHLEFSGLSVDLELDDLSIARVEFSGLNIDSELDGLSIACVEFSGSDVDSELDGLSIACVEFSGLDVDSGLDGLSIACGEFSGLNIDSELDGLSIACSEFSGLDIDSELDDLSIPSLLI
jgi:hypothetical protein